MAVNNLNPLYEMEYVTEDMKSMIAKGALALGLLGGGAVGGFNAAKGPYMRQGAQAVRQELAPQMQSLSNQVQQITGKYTGATNSLAHLAKSHNGLASALSRNGVVGIQKADPSLKGITTQQFYDATKKDPLAKLTSAQKGTVFRPVRQGAPENFGVWSQSQQLHATQGRPQFTPPVN